MSAVDDGDVQVGVRLLDAPVNRRDDPRAMVYIVDHVAPGTTFRRRIVVRNGSPIQRRIAVYPAGADVDKDGFMFAPDRTENELSSWVGLDQSEVDLKADQEREVWVTISVPKEASAGERYAMVWAEVADNPDPGVSVHNVGRAGIRIYLSVGQGGEPPSDFQITGLRGGRTPDGAPHVTADVKNTGQRALDLVGELSLTEGPNGLSTGAIRSPGATLGLGAATTVHILLDRRLPEGTWSARLALASGWTRRAVTGTISFGPVAPAPTVQPSAHSNDRILIGGLVTSALVLTALVGFAVRHRLSSRQRRKLV